jgi:hypothetical protein
MFHLQHIGRWERVASHNLALTKKYPLFRAELEITPGARLKALSGTGRASRCELDATAGKSKSWTLFTYMASVSELPSTVLFTFSTSKTCQLHLRSFHLAWQRLCAYPGRDLNVLELASVQSSKTLATVLEALRPPNCVGFLYCGTGSNFR